MENICICHCWAVINKTRIFKDPRFGSTRVWNSDYDFILPSKRWLMCMTMMLHASKGFWPTWLQAMAFLDKKKRFVTVNAYNQGIKCTWMEKICNIFLIFFSKQNFKVFLKPQMHWRLKNSLHNLVLITSKIVMV